MTKPKTGRHEKSRVEMELRLTGDTDALKAAFHNALPQPDDERPDVEKSLENVYFDTPQHDLRAQGLALRLRKSGEEQVQTLKAGDGASAVMLARREWETTVEGGRPDLSRLPKKAAALVLNTAPADQLEELFTTKVNRQIRRVTVNGSIEPPAEVEAVLDLGQIETKAGEQPIAEIEIELLEGSIDAVYDVALAINRQTPLQLETRSKSSRAYALLRKEPPAWQKARPVILDPSMSVDEAMAVVFASCFAQWTGNQAAALDGSDPEGVHQMRVGLRRLRSALSVFKNAVPADQLQTLKVEARAAIQQLGPARDWDVFKTEVLAPVIAAKPDDPGLKKLEQRVETRRRSAYRAAQKGILSAETTDVMLRFGRWIESHGWTVDGDKASRKTGKKNIIQFAAKLLKKRHRHALDMGRGFEGLSAEQRHDLRIALKKLRYACEFFVSLYGKKDYKSFHRSLKSLQDDLGQSNDIAIADDLLASIIHSQRTPSTGKLEQACGMVQGWHLQKLTANEPRLVGDWQSFTGRSAFWQAARSQG